MNNCPGDIVLFSGTGFWARLIQWWTRSKFYHAGIIIPNEACSDDRVVCAEDFLFEATALSGAACAIRGEKVRGVQAHWANDYCRGRDYAVLRLRKQWSELQLDCAVLQCLAMLGRRYDYGGALVSALRLTKQLFRRRAADRSEVFCIEFIGTILKAAYGTSPEMEGRLAGLKPGQMTPGEFFNWALESGLYVRVEVPRNVPQGLSVLRHALSF